MFLKYNIQTQKLVVWVDPIDGTKCYTVGDKDGVTCLIGISLGDTPIAGIINKPFGNSKYNTLFSIDKLGIFGYNILQHYNIPLNNNIDMNLLTPNIATKYRDKNRKILAMSMSDITNNKEKEYFNKIKYNKAIKMGGCGNKILSIVLNKCDIFILYKNYSKKWDTCAGHSFINAIGGDITQLNNNKILYSQYNDVKNSNGFVVTWQSGNFHDSFCI